MLNLCQYAKEARGEFQTICYAHGIAFAVIAIFVFNTAYAAPEGSHRLGGLWGWPQIDPERVTCMTASLEGLNENDPCRDLNQAMPSRHGDGILSVAWQDKTWLQQEMIQAGQAVAWPDMWCWGGCYKSLWQAEWRHRCAGGVMPVPDQVPPMWYVSSSYTTKGKMQPEMTPIPDKKGLYREAIVVGRVASARDGYKGVYLELEAVDSTQAPTIFAERQKFDKQVRERLSLLEGEWIEIRAYWRWYRGPYAAIHQEDQVQILDPIITELETKKQIADFCSGHN